MERIRPFSIWGANLFPDYNYTLPEAWSGVNWADLMAAQGAFGTDFYDQLTPLQASDRV